MSQDPQVTWVQADSLAIEIDPTTNSWHAGHVNDICAIGNDDILAATDTGGVWHIFPSSKPGEPVSYFALPLSQDWGNPDMSCLAIGPDGPLHIYAGCRLYSTQSPDRLYETNPLAHDPLNSWHSVQVPANAGTIYRIVVFKETRRIVLACDGGVFWASIPARSPRPTLPRPLPRIYRWQATQPSISNATGLAIGPGGTLAVAAKGQGFFHGQWQSSSSSPGSFDLLLQSTTPVNLNLARMARTSLASCENNLSLVYAVVAAPADANKYDPISMVLYSKDGGRSWVQLNPTIAGTTTLLKDAAGGQGYYNNCIAVSPSSPGTVAIGWQNGVFLSKDSANTWSQFQGNAGLHRDIHGLFFDAHHSDQPRLYIGSDGGIIMTPDLGRSFLSSYNQHLLDLQCMSTLERGFWGTFSVSPGNTNLVGSGLQDNGTVYSLLGDTPWKQAEGGDGTLAMYLQTGQFIYSVVDPSGEPVRISNWDNHTQSFVDSNVVHIVSGTTTSSGGIPDPTVEFVTSPQWRNHSQQLMYAVAGDNGPIYGLFAQDNGDNAHWEYLGNVFPRPQDGSAPLHPLPSGTIWSFGSFTGSTVFVGTTGGRLFLLDSASGHVQPLPVQQPNTDALPTRIVVASDSLAFATYNTATTGTILRWNGEQWENLAANKPNTEFPNERIYGLALTDKQELFAATDSRVYVSRDKGNTWNTASTGLPQLPHCAELRFGKDPQAGSFLYLSTFGRSVWQAMLASPESPGSLFGKVPRYTGWNTLIGSEADGRLYQLIAGRLQPVPPIDPELQKRMGEAYQNLLQGAATLQGLESVMEKQFAAAQVEPQVSSELLQASQRVLQGVAVLQTVGTAMEKVRVATQIYLPLQQASQRVIQGVATLQALSPELEKQIIHLNPQFKAQFQGAFQQISQATAALQTLVSEVEKQQK